MEKLSAIFKWLMSFQKSDWVLSDYPLRIQEQNQIDEAVPKYAAQIINWWQMTGVGNTREEAISDLNQMFLNIKENGETLPRPGTGLPIEFASCEVLEKYWSVVSRLIEEVLCYDIDEIFISDESSLWDFPEGDNKDYYFDKIKEIFGVDVSHIESGYISEISKYIHESSKADS